MIQSFKCRETEALFKGERIARFVNFERVALRKLEQLDIAARIEECACRPETGWKHYPATAPGNGVYVSTISDDCVSVLRIEQHLTWKSSIIIRRTS